MATFCGSQGSRHLLRSNIKVMGRALKELLLHLFHDWSKFVDCHQRDSDKDREKHGVEASGVKGGDWRRKCQDCLYSRLQAQFEGYQCDVVDEKENLQ